MAASFTVTTSCPVSAAEMFQRSLNIDAHLESLSHTGERVVGGVRTGQIGLGETVTWSARHFGIRFRMTSIISELVPGLRFVDAQVRGPFARFVHTHTFEDLDASVMLLADADRAQVSGELSASSIMIDEISYAAPFGLLGTLVERVILTRYLTKLISTRNRALVSLADKSH